MLIGTNDFQPKVTVTELDDMSLHVGETASVVILGPSGCGKTTLLDLIGGLDTPTEGTGAPDQPERDQPSCPAVEKARTRVGAGSLGPPARVSSHPMVWRRRVRP